MKNTLISILRPAIAAFFALWAAAFGVFSAKTAEASAPPKACSHLVAGTYLTTIVDAQGSLLSRSIITFHEDGTLLSIDSNQAGIPTQFNPFTANAGEWACTGRTSLSASAISFTLPGPEGPEQRLARNDFNAQIDPRTKALEGTVELIFFPLTADPFNGAGVSVGVFRFTAQPLRLHLH